MRTDIDPDGLLEYSVVYTDRSLNHMSQSFQGVMRDISRILKTVYNAHEAIVEILNSTDQKSPSRPRSPFSPIPDTLKPPLRREGPTRQPYLKSNGRLRP